jgi:hypothetical protein
MFIPGLSFHRIEQYDAILIDIGRSPAHFNVLDNQDFTDK